MNRNIKRVLAGAVLLTPLWMYMAWLCTPKKQLVAAIIDKTVLTSKGQEHASFSWVLNHEKYTKNKTSLYDVSSDYFGFFPGKDEQYKLKGLERFSTNDLEKLSNDADLVYVTDAYGIYRNEWYKENRKTERSGIVYGGMSTEDMHYLEMMKAKHKLILTEFNCIGSPTNDHIRARFEENFGLRWTGWTGRYFNSLDTLENPELPRWIIRDYQRDHNNQWNFKKAGIVFVNTTDEVVILETKNHLNDALPKIITNAAGTAHFNLPQTMPYPFWFDVTMADTAVNTVIANFSIDVNEAGKKSLTEKGIPCSFPAVQYHRQNDYTFFYFSADFSDNPVNLFSSRFSAVESMKFLFYNHFDELNRAAFFWKYYRPLVTTILKDYYHTKPKASQ
ncbi:hypothetical protein I5907_08240 [Panacibacter sp. DH6]|uniref:Uncharacterized protein n=1 Tax=Panacibacter microcysteis TaxID=2793269 RepID=A0A931E670_9BACT|nr:hypothetical protein [Panacibacter microcysteis]MBG9376221.1 hypothetical protein [Panacibacter microcysteis]